MGILIGEQGILYRASYAPMCMYWYGIDGIGECADSTHPTIIHSSCSIAGESAPIVCR